MKRKLRVGIVFGGRSSEHEVSLMSAASVLAALDRDRFEPVPIGITREGRWLLPADAAIALEKGPSSSPGPGVAFRPHPPDGATALAPLAALPAVPRGGSDRAIVPGGDLQLDVVFPVLHGPFGEDGTIQGLFELLDLPYVGAGVLGSAVGMDKVMQKDVLRRHGIETADYALVRATEWTARREPSLHALEACFAYPVFVKPANLGSSVGVRKAADRADLAQALDEAATYDRRIIVEESISGRELECSVLGDDDPEASIPGEILPSHEFYDYQAKYVDDSTRLAIPADLPQDVVGAIQDIAVRVFLALDASGLARVDFFLEPGGRLLVNELNTMPGFTRISMYPKLWEASGLPYRDLLTRLIDLALERHQQRAPLRSDRL